MIDSIDIFLRAVARLLVAQGAPFPEFAERMKAHYITAATESAGEKITDSRLSAMTGLQRRDVARLKGLQVKEPKDHYLSRLIALWQTDPEFAGLTDLPKTGETGSFEALAARVNKDVHPRTMLDTLCAAGAVGVTQDARVTRLQDSYQPLAGSEDQIAYLAKNVSDHLNAATQNVLSETPPNFERAVHYTRLTKDQIAELEADFSKAEMEVYRQISQKASKMKSQETGTHRFRAGSFFFKEPME